MWLYILDPANNYNVFVHIHNYGTMSKNRKDIVVTTWMSSVRHLTTVAVELIRLRSIIQRQPSELPYMVHGVRQIASQIHLVIWVAVTYILL